MDGKKVLIKHGVRINKKNFFLSEGTKLEILIENFFKINKVSFKKKQLSELIEEKNQYFILNNKVKFYNGVKETIKFFKKNNFSLAIVTAGSRKRIINTLPKNFLKSFDYLVTGDDYKNGKPSPEPYLKAMTLLKKKPVNCIVLENAPLGVLSGKRAKIVTVAVTNTVIKKYLKDADFIINSIHQLKNITNQINAQHT